MKPTAKRTDDGLRSDANDWEKSAFDHGKLNESWYAISYGTLEYTTWRKYFIDLGWMPFCFRRCEDDPDGNHSWTAPCRWPVDFPSEFDVVRKERKETQFARRAPRPMDRERIAEILRVFMSGRPQSSKLPQEARAPEHISDTWKSTKSPHWARDFANARLEQYRTEAAASDVTQMEAAE